MTNPSPALIDIVARAIADSDEYDGYWDRLTDTIGNPGPSLDTSPLEADAVMYRCEARAVLAAMPKPIGYAVTWTAYGVNHSYRFTEGSPQAERDFVATLLEADPDCGAAVVALVPVEGIHMLTDSIRTSESVRSLT